jgi:hypothetical protein
MNHKFKGLISLHDTRKIQVTFLVELSIVRLKADINDLIDRRNIEEDQHKNQVVKDFLRFSVELDEFERFILHSVNQHMLFWREVMSLDQNCGKVRALAEELIACRAECRHRFEGMLELNNCNVRLLDMYANYLREVEQDYEQSQQLYGKARLARRLMDE